MPDNFWTDELVFEFIDFCEEFKKSHVTWWTSEAVDEFKKSKQRKPLFTTTDGKDIYEGDEYVKVNNYSDYSIVSGFTAEGNHNDYKGLKFSTKEAANEYVYHNAPKLSVNEIMPIVKQGGFIELKLIELVKQKIKNV